MPDRSESCQGVCTQCHREGVADVKSGLCEVCIQRVEDQTVQAMFLMVEQMRRWGR